MHGILISEARYHITVILKGVECSWFRLTEEAYHVIFLDHLLLSLFPLGTFKVQLVACQSSFLLNAYVCR